MTREGKSRKNFFENIRHYIDLKLEYFRLDLSEKMSVLVGKLILVFFMAILALALMLLLLMLLHSLLIQWIGISWVATLIEIGIVILMMILLWCFKEKFIINPVANTILRTFYESDEQTTEDKKQLQD